MLKPLALGGLAYPSGLSLSPEEDVLYVSEMMANRVLRFVQVRRIDAVEAPRGALRLARTSSSYRLSTKPMASPLHTPQRPAGVYHYSVFRQFAGGVGPTALACDSSGRLYVARFELRTCQGTGSVDVINPDGSLEESIAIPAPEVSGLCISPAGDALYVTESSTNTVYRISL